jgi:CheY-like chemotaxis protein
MCREAVLSAADYEHAGNQTPPTPLATILFVEDHADSLRVMTRLLVGAGYDVHPAATLAEAQQLARDTTFDLLISDLGLPDGSGADLLRSMSAQRPMKAIAISGYDMGEHIRRAQDAGFARHVTKPVNFQVLMDTIREVLA